MWRNVTSCENLLEIQIPLFLTIDLLAIVWPMQLCVRCTTKRANQCTSPYDIIWTYLIAYLNYQIQGEIVPKVARWPIDRI